MSSEEESYVRQIERIWKRLFGVKPRVNFRKSEKACDLRCFKKELFEFLVNKVNLKESPKWNTAMIPDFCLGNSLELEVLRGYFDTDGSLVLTDNNGVLYPRLEMKICPSPMQNQFVEILERQGFRYGVYDIGDGKVRVQMNGEGQLNRWIERVSFRNRKHLEKLKILKNT